ncbi:MAG: S26 family signal peptidase [Caulobacter sp.]|nr:S26 family signal peptidase [Caulobacter sp.]
MSRRRIVSVAAVAAIGCLLVLRPGERPAPRLLFNTTASAPLGFYLLTPGRFAKGQLAAVTPPSALADWMARRGYLPANVPLLKEVAAVGGQSVCGIGDVLSIDGRPVARILPRDRQGRALPAYQECRRLAPDEVLLLNRHAPNSLDGRYFGPVSARQVTGGARSLWTWEARR